MTLDGLPPDVRELARLIPADILMALDESELGLRLAYASELMAEARVADEGKGKRLRSEAAAVLKAMPVRELADKLDALAEGLRKARLDGDENMAKVIVYGMGELDRANPRPPDDWVITRYLVGRVNEAEAVKPPRRFWNRRNSER